MIGIEMIMRGRIFGVFLLVLNDVDAAAPVARSRGHSSRRRRHHVAVGLGFFR